MSHRPPKNQIIYLSSLALVTASILSGMDRQVCSIAQNCRDFQVSILHIWTVYFPLGT
ncbi:uncharacterized protein BYT42DRAFT_580868 [Radiomyces spectabilis]|uniref:uncharacterized protein n=1 Tax=Radiomyces spectabilis TaxID=64574 RepID=UPI0022200965|nr:uncharacterized protein BYT42DRAFT_580868 [Radiomyces spectabilis]KAI8371613.1 hypothetical protein BYT42DRAFT_580868 [Radiomyces spectabilis]